MDNLKNPYCATKNEQKKKKKSRGKSESKNDQKFNMAAQTKPGIENSTLLKGVSSENT